MPAAWMEARGARASTLPPYPNRTHVCVALAPPDQQCQLNGSKYLIGLAAMSTSRLGRSGKWGAPGSCTAPHKGTNPANVRSGRLYSVSATRCNGERKEKKRKRASGERARTGDSTDERNRERRSNVLNGVAYLGHTRLLGDAGAVPEAREAGARQNGAGESERGEEKKAAGVTRYPKRLSHGPSAYTTARRPMAVNTACHYGVSTHTLSGMGEPTSDASTRTRLFRIDVDPKASTIAAPWPKKALVT
ncbi:hypothetical protein FRC08_007631 [Ceratobasidium sp. 394]|nr:hypothetical protein FRC08_007631 [Ceratobasidium sp. 394]